jgi:hypothetical protein
MYDNYRCCNLLVDLYIKEILPKINHQEWIFDFELYNTRMFYYEL